MAVSNSIDFELNVAEYIEEAFERCGLEVRTGGMATKKMRGGGMVKKMRGGGMVKKMRGGGMVKKK